MKSLKFNPGHWVYVTKHLSPYGRHVLRSLVGSEAKLAFLVGFQAANGIPQSIRHSRETFEYQKRFWGKIKISKTRSTNGEGFYLPIKL